MSEAFYPFVVDKLSEEDGGGYVARAIDLYGCIGDGETPFEAFACLLDAIEEWKAEMVRLGRPIPEPGSAFKEAIEERTELLELVKLQHEILQQQADKIAEQTGSLKVLHERVERLIATVHQLAHDTDTGEGEEHWTPTALAVAAAANRLKNAPH